MAKCNRVGGVSKEIYLQAKNLSMLPTSDDWYASFHRQDKALLTAYAKNWDVHIIG